MKRGWAAAGVAMGLLAGCRHRAYPHWDTPAPMHRPEQIEGLNSPFDDFNSAQSPRMENGIVFSTNRGSRGHDFDFYGAALDWDHDGRDMMPSHFHVTQEPRPVLTDLRSDANERGPIFILPDDNWPKGYETFAFASDRPGGQGGLDLYSTVCTRPVSYFWRWWEDMGCDVAENLRPMGVNSASDDAYVTRPFEHRHVLFSSNRPRPLHADTNHHLHDALWDAGQSIQDAPRASAPVEMLNSDADDDAPFVYDTSYGPKREVVFVSSREGGLGEHDLYCARYDENGWSAPVHLVQYSSPRDEYRPIVIEMGARFLLFSSTREGGQGGYDLYIVGYDGCP
ncbi:MAG TPA: hypothetical protein VGM90_09245 [Kofleriaceae bacterium]|jgi:hypothetical protein